MLLADLRHKVEPRIYEVSHDVPRDDIQEKQMNFLRGEIAAFEELLNLAEDYREWKENK